MWRRMFREGVWRRFGQGSHNAGVGYSSACSVLHSAVGADRRGGKFHLCRIEPQRRRVCSGAVRFAVKPGKLKHSPPHAPRVSLQVSLRSRRPSCCGATAAICLQGEDKNWCVVVGSLISVSSRFCPAQGPLQDKGVHRGGGGTEGRACPAATSCRSSINTHGESFSGMHAHMRRHTSPPHKARARTQRPHSRSPPPLSPAKPRALPSLVVLRFIFATMA